MPSILVVEHEARYRERVHDALTAEGWQVQGVADVPSALRVAAAERPLLVLVANDLPDARSLFDRFGRRRGGPGAVVLVAERDAGLSADAIGADELLTKPFTDQDIRLVVRRCLNAAMRAATEAAAGTHRFSSEELFGDVLAEVEERAPSPKPAPRPAAPSPAAAVDLGSKLERTLSGLRDLAKPRAAAAARPASPAPAAPPPKPGRSAGRELDDLISKTLSGLDTTAGKGKAAPGTGTPRSAPSAPAAMPPPPPPPAEPDRAKVMQATPAPAPPAEKTQRIATVDSTWEAPPLPEVALSVAPAVEPPAPVVVAPTAPPVVPAPATAATATTPARRTGEIDLSQLEEMARPRTKTGAGRESGVRPAADLFGTQRMPTVQRDATPSGPREFGQYSLLERIALGGMAEVWKARRRGVEGFQKTVAIKRILPHLTDSVDFVTMFIDEAKLAAQLTHNNIIHIYDLGKIGDDYFIAMEYVEGKDLRSILNAARNQGRPLPMGLALLVGARLASALDYAHRKRDFDNRELGLVHRDVSPQNVLIGFEGDIKLCDFGIVKAVSKASRTQMGALKGKLQYMSPEQAWGKSVDARSDIFSLGVVLFEMLTGRRLFTGDNEMSVLEAVRDGRLQRPRDLVPAIPAEVDALVVHALAKDPDERFQTAGQMQKEMERILHGLHPAPTPADLAAYMHQLFAAEARDAGATLSESGAGDVRVAFGELAAAAAAGAATPASAEAPVIVPKPGGAAAPEGEGKGKLVLFGAIAAAVLVGIGIYFWRGRSTQPAPADVPAPAPISAPATPPEPTTDPAASPQVPTEASTATPPAAAQPLDAAAAALAAKQEELRRLETQKRELDARAAAKKEAAQTPAAATTPPPAPEPAPASPAVEEPEPAPVPATPAPAEPEPVAATPPAQAEPAPASPRVNQGDLVAMGPGVVPPTLVSAPNPTYPPPARQRGIEGTVAVHVLVDENGVVRDTKVLKGPGGGLNESAREASKRARFRPATKDGVRVKMWFTLNFPFKL